MKGDERFHVITVDWRNAAAVDWKHFETTYFAPAAFTKEKAAPAIKNLLILLKTLNPVITCIGHSLGAQTCGALGREMKRVDMKIDTIHGLDPAGPCFDKTNTLLSGCPSDLVDLKNGDAEFVSIIHTNPGHLGSTVS